MVSTSRHLSSSPTRPCLRHVFLLPPVAPLCVRCLSSRSCHVTAGQPVGRTPTCSGRRVEQRDRLTRSGHVLNLLSVFVSLYFRIAFSGSECLLLSLLCALSRLLSSFPIVLCFQPLCCLVSSWFVFSAFPLSNASPWPLTHLLLSGAFPPAPRLARGPATQRGFAFPLPVYPISNAAQPASEHLHVLLSLVCSLLLPISPFSFIAMNLKKNQQTHNC